MLRPNVPALANALRQLEQLAELYLAEAFIDDDGMCLLRPALRKLGRLTRLELGVL